MVKARFDPDPDFLATRICEASKELPVEFIQKFYGMTEGEVLGAPLRRTMGSIATNHVIRIPPEPLKTLKQNDCEHFEVPIPQSHIGLKEVTARLLAPFRHVAHVQLFVYLLETLTAVC